MLLKVIFLGLAGVGSRVFSWRRFFTKKFRGSDLSETGIGSRPCKATATQTG